jgi:exoribonuclease R
MVDNKITGFAMLDENPARNIIESFMVAANASMARFLRARNSLCVRRIVRTPKR